MEALPLICTLIAMSSMRCVYFKCVRAHVCPGDNDNDILYVSNDCHKIKNASIKNTEPSGSV